MSTRLTSTIIDNAKESVQAYINTVGALNSDLDGVLSQLRLSYAGDASDGYMEFYNTRVQPTITENLIGTGASLTANILSILDNIKQQLLDTVDPQLGDYNRNPDSGDT